MSSTEQMNATTLLVESSSGKGSAARGQLLNEVEPAFDRTDLIRIGLVALAAIAVWLHLWQPFTRISVIGVLATVIGGYPIFKEAFENIVDRKVTMELSMTIA